MTNKIYKYGVASLVFMMGATFTSCGDFEPTGYEELAALPTVSNLKADRGKGTQSTCHGSSLLPATSPACSLSRTLTPATRLLSMQEQLPTL